MDKIADRAGTPKSEDSGMIIRVIIFEVTIHNRPERPDHDSPNVSVFSETACGA